MPRGIYSRPSTTVRFWLKVDRTPGLGPNGDCWEWKINKKRHGQIYHEGQTVGAHVFSWFLHRGKWPKSCILHKCDNPVCVNPNHLFEGNHADNVADMVSKKRNAKGQIQGNAILSDDQVKNDVIPSLKKGERGRSIAKRLGVHECTISAIKRKRNWRHV